MSDSYASSRVALQALEAAQKRATAELLASLPDLIPDLTRAAWEPPLSQTALKLLAAFRSCGDDGRSMARVLEQLEGGFDEDLLRLLHDFSLDANLPEWAVLFAYCRAFGVMPFRARVPLHMVYEWAWFRQGSASFSSFQHTLEHEVFDVLKATETDWSPGTSDGKGRWYTRLVVALADLADALKALGRS